jgi:antitoxin component of MazEF toxin-antitoxin module
MLTVYKKNLLKIGDARGVYIPMIFVKELRLHEGYVKLYQKNNRLYIEKIVSPINIEKDVYIKTIKIAGGSYKITLPKKIIRGLKTDVFEVYRCNNKVIIKNIT